jgi:hypothetical protein
VKIITTNIRVEENGYISGGKQGEVRCKGEGKAEGAPLPVASVWEIVK